MREAGRLAAEVLEMISDHVRPGISTGELDKICHDYIIEEQKAIPANVGYRVLKNIMYKYSSSNLPWNSRLQSHLEEWRYYEYRCHRHQGWLAW